MLKMEKNLFQQKEAKGQNKNKWAEVSLAFKQRVQTEGGKHLLGPSFEVYQHCLGTQKSSPNSEY